MEWKEILKAKNYFRILMTVLDTKPKFRRTWERTKTAFGLGAGKIFYMFPPGLSEFD